MSEIDIRCDKCGKPHFEGDCTSDPTYAERHVVDRSPMPEVLRQLRLDRVYMFDGIEDHRITIKNGNGKAVLEITPHGVVEMAEKLERLQQVLHHTKEHCGKLEAKLSQIREVLK